MGVEFVGLIQEAPAQLEKLFETLVKQPDPVV